MEERLTTAGVLLRGGKVLLALRREGGSVGGLWEFPGGKVRRGEAPEEALVRELREELGLEVEVRECIYTGSFRNGQVRYTLLGFLVETEGEPRLNEMHADLRWWDVGSVREEILVPSDRPLLKALLYRSKE
ncbi:NUDIX hydrolase [Spirochaeta thermophila DSM 6578]|uniref:8-oxo-dGTP diphosphatase n=1 Tax=Winmispira thermophila (strain ATCC 700085 / DSM 6578 / Z-1203) TaxID=869211 RepID=G0G9Y7_WINT7|nr:(deoxy)nucleoside triphosphate pyrophosphohydrolase [Spirochaeta thermophila]AEJ61675.1 NUDIX hydrolase [Spirochaeta thermophila DSM 6578]